MELSVLLLTWFRERQEAFPSPGCVISTRALEQGLALAAGVFPAFLT